MKDKMNKEIKRNRIGIIISPKDKETSDILSEHIEEYYKSMGIELEEFKTICSKCKKENKYTVPENIKEFVSICKYCNDKKLIKIKN